MSDEYLKHLKTNKPVYEKTKEGEEHEPGRGFCKRDRKPARG